jgi:lipid A oxidase
MRMAVMAAAMAAMALPAQAEVEIGIYGGAQSAPHSRVKGSDPGGVGDFNFLAGWEGNSFAMPPYYGVRATWWRSARLGFGIEFNHAKVYADDETRADSGFSVLEMTDGLNILTANVMYRWPEPGRAWTPYVGAGVGLSIPHVEATSSGGSVFEYQVTGPAAALIAGVSYSLNDRWSVFTEYKGTYSVNEMELGSGGTMKTNIVTNALNVGVALRF